MAEVVINQGKQLKNIDFADYEVEEAVETILDLIVFPLYIAKSVITTSLVFIASFILICYLTTDHIWSGLLLFLLCFITSIPTQVFTA
ncbi:MAG: hypothetical protein MRY83_07620, partial [Flavobacteriales bacterium]|nr:hypothetical protein [Flavobacteriales bacterium]